MKNKGIALLLCFFLGWMGAHKFYLGKGGLLYLLFCWSGVPLIISLFDFIGLLIMSQEKFDRKYNTGIGVISHADELTKLAQLKEAGHITTEEFEKKKKQILK